MKNTFALAATVCLAILLTSCSHRIVGTWTVQRYETTSPGKESTVLSNVGVMKFNKNGSGEKELKYSVLGITQNDQVPFTWIWSDDKYVSIDSKGSEFGKTWIIMQNERNFQKWKSTDGNNKVQVLELTKP